ncbi:hypothetical protein GYB22_11350 [bacterium]|nr:hypothetical protein [bacterium]
MRKYCTAPYKNQAYYIKFKCFENYSLIELSDAYYSMYKWFAQLILRNVKLYAYAMSPHQFEGIIYIPSSCPAILNKLVGNGKRFIAYEIVRGLKEKHNWLLMTKLNEALNQEELDRGKKHRVFDYSFYWEPLYSKLHINAYIDLIHRQFIFHNQEQKLPIDRIRHTSIPYYNKDYKIAWINKYKRNTLPAIFTGIY